MVLNGNKLENNFYQREEGTGKELCRIRNRTGELLALGSIDKFGGLVPKTVLAGVND
jgi:hypothetical protein